MQSEDCWQWNLAEPLWSQPFPYFEPENLDQPLRTIPKEYSWDEVTEATEIETRLRTAGWGIDNQTWSQKQLKLKRGLGLQAEA